MVRRLVPDDVHQRVRIGDCQAVKRPLRGLAVVSLGGRKELAQDQSVCLTAYQRCIRAADRKHQQHRQRREAGRRSCVLGLKLFTYHRSNLRSVCECCQMRPSPAQSTRPGPGYSNNEARPLLCLTNSSPRGHLHSAGIRPDSHDDVPPGRCLSHRSDAGRPSPRRLRSDCRSD